MTDHIARIRAFNRDYTRTIGLLNEGLMESEFGLAEARVIHEIGKLQPVTAVEIAARLGMDRGQLSRIVNRLTRHGILTATRSQTDGRARALSLSANGETACARLNANSDDSVSALIADLTDRQREKIVGAMETISGLMGAAHPDTDPDTQELRFRSHRLGELGWLIGRQGLLYSQEFGWNAEFEALIARIYSEYELAPESPPKKLWIAETDGRIAGSIFVLPNVEDPTVAQLRMLYVEPWARGRGIGDKLVQQVISFSEEAGYRSIMLWTQSCLVAARKIYDRAGFTLESEETHHSFGQDLLGQYLIMDLAKSQ